MLPGADGFCVLCLHLLLFPPSCHYQSFSRVIENGQERVEVEENGELKSIHINGKQLEGRCVCSLLREDLWCIKQCFSDSCPQVVVLI